MVWRLIDFANVVFKLSMFKVYGIIGISKIELFHFFGIERVKQNKEKIKKHEKLPTLLIQSHFKYFQQNPNIFFVFSLKL